MDQAEKLENLRRLLSPQKGTLVPLGHPVCDRILGGGIAAGSLHEIFLSAAGDEGTASGFALALAARLSPAKPLFWIRQDFSALEYGEACAGGLSAFGIDPARLVIVRVADAKMGLRACGEVLSCAHVGTVLFELSGKAPAFDLAASRRLALAAQTMGISIILLRLNSVPEPSAATTRWRIGAAPGAGRFEAELIRNRYGGTGRWLMEWNNEQRIFRVPFTHAHPQQAAHSGSVVAASSNRPAQTAALFRL